MKTPVTITMLAIGGLLLMAPYISNAFHEHELSTTYIARSDITSLTFGNEQSELSRFGCWLVGTGLCVVAVIGAAKDARRSP